MILNETKNTVDRGGDVQERKYSINATGKAFRVLSDGLYTYKHRAIVRELCCNAFDAQVAAGRGHIPFEVHLPSMTEPWFGVRDTGIGLTVREAMGGYDEIVVPAGSLNPDGSVVLADYVIRQFKGGIFNTYFESTKTESNDFIGALGLGSKSPFCYVDNFTVISRKDGMKFTFSVFINEHDEPSIALLDECPTDEINGVEIQVPVAQNDHYKFSEESATVLKWFDPLPKIGCTIPTRTYAYKGDGWAMADRSLGYSDKAVAVMGKIAYPLSGFEEVARGMAHGTLTNTLSLPLVLYFENGALEFAASREHLSFKPTTIARITLAIEKFQTEITPMLQATIDACQTPWEARRAYHEMQKDPLKQKLLSGVTIKFQGSTLDTTWFKIPVLGLGDTMLTTFNSRGKVRRFKASSNDQQSFNIQAEDNTQIIIDDLPRGAQARVKKYKEQNSGKTVMMFRFDNDTQKNDFLKTIHGAPVILASSLPGPTRTYSGRASIPDLKVISYANGYYHENTYYGEVDFDEGGYYMLTSRGSHSYDGEKISDLNILIGHARTMNLIDATMPIYCVPVSRASVFKRHSEWKNIYEEIKESAVEAIDAIRDTASMEIAQHQNYVLWSMNIYSTRLMNLANAYLNNVLPLDHPLMVLQEHARDVKHSRFNTEQQIISMLGLRGFGGVLPAFDFPAAWSKILAKYPMMKNFGQVTDKNTWDDYLAYMAMVDKSIE